MTDVTIYGFPQSTFVRTACLACEEKGVSYERRDIELGSDELRAMHPFGKIPVLRHGDLTVFETIAITRYIDKVFAGPALQPAEARAGALMDQSISSTCSYLYASVIHGIVLPRIGFTPLDEAAVAEAKGKAGDQLGVFDDALAGSAWLAGDGFSLADMFLAPVLFWLWTTPEGKDLQPSCANVARWYAAVSERASFQATTPPMPG